MEQVVQNGNPVNEVGTGSEVLTVFHTMILEEESGKILEQERVTDVEKDEERGGSYYVDPQPGSLAPEPSSLGSHQLSFTTIELPAYFGDANPVLPISKSELNHELVGQSGLPGQAEVHSQNMAEKETNRRHQTHTAASAVAPGGLRRPEQVQTAKQNHSLSQGICQSARCTAALSVGQQPGRPPSSRVSSQGGTKEQEVPPEPPEEPAPPLRKKTRTFYSSGRLLGAHVGLQGLGCRKVHLARSVPNLFHVKMFFEHQQPLGASLYAGLW